MTAADFITLLEQHDWYYDHSDDNRAYAAGHKSRDKLLFLCQQQPELFRLYNHAETCIIRSLPFDFQSVLGTSPRKDEKQHTQTHHPMKDILQQVFDICIKPLVEAINNLAADVRFSSGKSPATLDAPETPAPVVEKSAKPAKAKPAPAPPPEPETEAPAITEARLRETVKTLPPEGKAKIQAYFKQKFKHNTFAEITEDHYADIHAAAIKIGAVDTDPGAPADISDMP